MIDAAGFAAWLLLPLAGLALWRLRDVRSLALDGRIAIAGAAGALIVATVMSAMSAAGIGWTRARLVVVIAALACASLFAIRHVRREPATPVNRAVLAGLLVLFAIFVYALLTARATIGDLLYFWGPKGVHFALAGTIDVDYLRNPDHFLQHRDYPPLLPLLFAWSTLFTGGFSWWAALLASGLCLAAVAAMIRSFARDDLAALLATAVLAWCLVRPWVAGGADPLLLVYETLAVCAATFVRDAKSQTILLAIGLGGAAVTKVEGASFVAAAVVAMLLGRVPWRRVAVALIAPSLLLGAWLLFLWRAELFDTYLGPGSMSLRYLVPVLRGVLREASYDACWIPWIAPLAIVFLGDWRRARLPLLVAAITLTMTVTFYLRSPSDPTIFWIPSSAPRVLLTPLAMLLIAAAAAHAREEAPTEA